MKNDRHARRVEVRKALKELRDNAAKLKVVGAQGEYRLAVQTGNGLVPIGLKHPKQTNAVEFGQKSLGKKASRVVAKKAS